MSDLKIIDTPDATKIALLASTIDKQADEIERLESIVERKCKVIGIAYDKDRKQVERIAELEAACDRRRDALKQARDLLDERFKRIAELEAACDRRRDALKQARDLLDERFKRIAELEAALRDALEQWESWMYAADVGAVCQSSNSDWAVFDKCKQKLGEQHE